MRKSISSECEDLNAHCDMWEQLGHCKHSAKYMGHYCRKSCKLCSTGKFWIDVNIFALAIAEL